MLKRFRLDPAERNQLKTLKDNSVVTETIRGRLNLTRTKSQPQFNSFTDWFKMITSNCISLAEERMNPHEGGKVTWRYVILYTMTST